MFGLERLVTTALEFLLFVFVVVFGPSSCWNSFIICLNLFGLCLLCPPVFGLWHFFCWKSIKIFVNFGLCCLLMGPSYGHPNTYDWLVCHHLFCFLYLEVLQDLSCQSPPPLMTGPTLTWLCCAQRLCLGAILQLRQFQALVGFLILLFSSSLIWPWGMSTCWCFQLFFLTGFLPFLRYTLSNSFISINAAPPIWVSRPKLLLSQRQLKAPEVVFVFEKYDCLVSWNQNWNF